MLKVAYVSRPEPSGKKQRKKCETKLTDRSIELVTSRNVALVSLDHPVPPLHNSTQYSHNTYDHTQVNATKNHENIAHDTSCNSNTNQKRTEDDCHRSTLHAGTDPLMEEGDASRAPPEQVARRDAIK